MKIKKILTAVLAITLAVGLTACGSKSGSSSNGGNSENAKKGEVSVFYYTYSDTYISSVRSAMDKLLTDGGYKFQNYDANGNQTTQTEQVTTALAKGSKLLVVNVVDTGSNDAAQNIINLAKEQDVPVIFFNRSVDESVVSSYEKCVFVGTDYEMAGHMQGEMIGKYLTENFDKVDLNGDGKISYVVFKGQEGNMEAIARTKFGVEDANTILKNAGKPELVFYDPSNSNKYLVDQNGQWSSAAATDYMSTILAQYSEANKNMVELVIANNDEMALGAISGLQAAGYNNGNGKSIPVFGIDATDAAKEAISKGNMVGTIKQDADGMASAITTIGANFFDNKTPLDGINSDEIVGNWRVNIPYSTYTGK